MCWRRFSAPVWGFINCPSLCVQVFHPLLWCEERIFCCFCFVNVVIWPSLQQWLGCSPACCCAEFEPPRSLPSGDKPIRGGNIGVGSGSGFTPGLEILKNSYQTRQKSLTVLKIEVEAAGAYKYFQITLCWLPVRSEINYSWIFLILAPTTESLLKYLSKLSLEKCDRVKDECVFSFRSAASQTH